MIEFLEKQGVSQQAFAKNKETGQVFDKGILKKSADSGGNIGAKVVEKFLRTFPEVNPEWLILGEEPVLKSEKTLFMTEEDSAKYGNRVQQLEETLNLYRRLQKSDEERKLLEEEVKRLKKGLKSS